MSLAALLAFAAATPFADLDAIDRAVAAFTGTVAGENGSAQVTPVDRRLRLRPCPAPLALAWRTTARESVIVQCPEPGGWRLFVPVRGAGPGASVPEMPAINRGDAVAIAVRGEGFSVSRPGEALEAGALGSWIRVRPAAESRAGGEALRAQVVRPGLVALPLP